MNPALIAVLAVVAAKRKVAERLLAAGATTPERARPLSESDLRLTGDLARAGVLREAAPGRYYLDEAAFAAWNKPHIDQAAMRRVAVGIGLALLAALVLALLLLYFDR